VLVVYDSRHRLHADPQLRHPENPSRTIKVIEALIKSEVSSQLSFVGVREPEEEVLLLVHDPEYVEYVKRESSRGFHYIDPDTYVNEHTYLISASYMTTTYYVALDSLSSREAALVVPRPGGHHAGRSGRALGAPTLGFCIFNYAAVASAALLKKTNKVLIIDFDAHHGNGTQEIFWDDGRVVHVDIHQEGIYPGTGDVLDVGSGAGEGKMINIPVSAGAGDETYMWVLEEIIKKLVEVFKPGALVVSAGFDAHLNDPLTSLAVTKITYRNIGAYLGELLARNEVMSVVSVVEGGYGEGLVPGVINYVNGLLTRSKHPNDVKAIPAGLRKRVKDSLKSNLSRYWGIEIRT
jgi:acetoin utilization deacetylase AcuC-like enzyme